MSDLTFLNNTSYPPAITINASDVVLDVHAHIITITSGTFGVEVVDAGAEISNVVVRKGTLRNCNVPIDVSAYYFDVHDITFRDLILDGASAAGVQLYSSQGAGIDASVYNINIANCAIYGGIYGSDDRDNGGDHFVDCIFNYQSLCPIFLRGNPNRTSIQDLENLNTVISQGTIATQTTP